MFSWACRKVRLFRSDRQELFLLPAPCDLGRDLLRPRHASAGRRSAAPARRASGRLSFTTGARCWIVAAVVLIIVGWRDKNPHD